MGHRGYRVIGVDLRGHGASARGTYRGESWADDLAETLPAGADLALGHSLGATALVLAAETGSLVSPALQAELTRHGFDVRTVAGTGHSIHRDDFDAFMAALDGWIRPRAAS